MSKAMRRAAWAALGLALLALGPAGAMGETGMRKMTLLQRVGPQVYEQAGLAALSPSQQQALADWLERYTQDVVRATEQASRRLGPDGSPPTWQTPK